MSRVLSNIREISDSFSQKPPLQPSHYQSLAMQTQIVAKIPFPPSEAQGFQDDYTEW